MFLKLDFFIYNWILIIQQSRLFLVKDFQFCSVFNRHYLKIVDKNNKGSTYGETWYYIHHMQIKRSAFISTATGSRVLRTSLPRHIWIYWSSFTAEGETISPVPRATARLELWYLSRRWCKLIKSEINHTAAAAAWLGANFTEHKHALLPTHV